MTTTTARIQHRRDAASTWTSVNPVLLLGEIGYETDNRRWKIGDGTTPWSSLPYQSPDAATLANTYAPVLSAVSAKTGAYTTPGNEVVPVDATAAAVTVTLPTTPADKVRVTVKKLDSSANVVTVARGGSSDVFNRAGGGTSLPLSLQNQAVTVQYAASTAVWIVINDDFPLSSLTSAFPSIGAPADPYSGGEPQSTDYKVAINGVPAFVHVARVQDSPFDPATVGYSNGGNYSFVNFDAPVGGTTVVDITSTTANLARCELITRRTNVLTSVTRRPGWVRFTLTGPAKIVLVHNGNLFPLMLFGNPTETTINLSDPNVIYIGPGVTPQPSSGPVQVTAGKTLYLHRDAVLAGSVAIVGDGATVRGRGIISGNLFTSGGATTHPLIDNHGNNSTIEGVTLRGNATWSLPSWYVDNVNITNVKVVGGRQQNDDGINFIGATHGTVSDCFIRTYDDCIALKGLDSTKALQNISFTDMTLWGDVGRILLIGHESQATMMDTLSLTQSLIVRAGFTFYPLLIQPGDGLTVSNVTITDVTMRGDSQGLLLQIQTAPTGTTSSTAGKVNGVTVARLTVAGSGGVYATEIHGMDSTHQVQNVSITDLYLNGTKITAVGGSYRIGSFTSAITIA